MVRWTCNCSRNTHSRNSQTTLGNCVWACFSMFAFGLFALKIRKFRMEFLQHVCVWAFTGPTAEMKRVTGQKKGLKLWELVKVKSLSKTHRSDPNCLWRHCRLIHTVMKATKWKNEPNSWRFTWVWTVIPLLHNWVRFYFAWVESEIKSTYK